MKLGLVVDGFIVKSGTLKELETHIVSYKERQRKRREVFNEKGQGILYH